MIEKEIRMKKAIVTGITGQDGAYLAELLLDKGYEVYGTYGAPPRSTSGATKSWAFTPTPICTWWNMT